MKLDDLIAFLEAVKAKKGNIEVKFTSFCGTDNNHVMFDIAPVNADRNVDDFMNDLGHLCLSGTISQESRQQIVEGINDMKRLGYRFIHSQFVKQGEKVREGLSPCEWHNPW